MEPSSKGTLLKINFKVKKVKNTSLFRYTIVDALSRIGSLFTASMIIGKLIVNLFNLKIFNFELIKSLFTFEDGMFGDKKEEIKKVGPQTPLLQKSSSNSFSRQLSIVSNIESNFNKNIVRPNQERLVYSSWDILCNIPRTLFCC